jgi:hypothetical protein
VNWEAVGAVGEIVGALAVIATLGYVAAQIRQNTHSVTTAVYESAMAGFNEHIRFVASDAELSSILRRGSIAPASLDDEELFRFTFVIRHYVNHVYKLFRLYEQGVFPKGEWRNVAGEAVQLFSMPGLAEFKDKNEYYADLWTAMDDIEAADFSSFNFIRESSSEG